MSNQVQPITPGTPKVATVDMTQGQFKELVVFAVVGAGFHSMDFADWATHEMLALKIINEDRSVTYEWMPDSLGRLTIESLLKIFREIRGHNQPKKVH